MSENRCTVINVEGGVPIKAWTKGVPFEKDAEDQLRNVARLPFLFKWVAAMPDVHAGVGATIGSVIPTRGAVIPSAVGVDIGCGMMAVRTSLKAGALPKDLLPLRQAIEKGVPHGRTHNGGPGDRGAWHDIPAPVAEAWNGLKDRYAALVSKYPRRDRGNDVNHLGTLGTGNHFIEVCLDEAENVWFMLHSGSRGVGNRIGAFFIDRAKEEMDRWFIRLPDRDLAYFPEGTDRFEDYVRAAGWAQDFAAANRDLMMRAVVVAARAVPGIPPFESGLEAVNCHHNYLERENHFRQNVIVTRKGAIRARAGEMGIIPGSMGARSYIVRGKGSEESFTSCSHGAGRAMSRSAAKRKYTVADHAAATAGIECRKDAEVIDEMPLAYKSIDAVMEAQGDLVEVVHTLRQVACVKG